jgi:hypothetical protein
MTAYQVWCRVTLLAADHSTKASWLLTGRGRPSLEVVDRLARIRLDASRYGHEMCLSDVCVDLRDLLDLAGLRQVVGGRDA